MSKEDPFEELQDECYICFEPCKTKAPCHCQTYVHKKCLRQFQETSGNYETCMICLQPYQHPHKNLKKYFFYTFSAGLMYIATGMIGTFIWDISSDHTIQVEPPWSIKHFLAAVVASAVIVFLYSIVIRYRITV